MSGRFANRPEQEVASMSKNEQLFGIAHGALTMGVSKDTVRRLADKGEIRTVYVGARRLIPASEIERVISLGAGPRSRKGKSKATSARR